MLNNHYPLVDSKFFVSKILECEKIDVSTYFNVGSTHSVQLKGNKALHKRFIVFREIDGEITYLTATGLAALYGFMSPLLDWYLEHKQWKEGSYIVNK